MGIVRIYLISLLCAVLTVSLVYLFTTVDFIINSKSVNPARNVLRETVVKLIAVNSVNNQKIKNSWDYKKIIELENFLRYGNEKYGIPELVALSFINHGSSMYVYAKGINRDKNTGFIKSVDFGLSQINGGNVSSSDIDNIYSIKTNLKYFYSLYGKCVKQYGLFTERSIVCYNYPKLAKIGSYKKVKSYPYTIYILNSYFKVKKIYSLVLDGIIKNKY